MHTRAVHAAWATITITHFCHAIAVFKEGKKLSRKTVICILARNALRSPQTEGEKTNFIP